MTSGTRCFQRCVDGTAQQDVGRLQVAVQDAAFVSVMDRAGHGRHQPRGRARVVGVTLDMVGQVAAFNQFHAEVVVAFVFADLVDRHDMRMIQVRGRFGFQAEAMQIAGRREPARPHHLDAPASRFKLTCRAL